MPLKTSLDNAYFEAIYNGSDDPWNFTGSPYEADKYNRTVASLPACSYDSALEVGCSIGVLTAMLAIKCKSLLAVDISEKALAQARWRCSGLAHVRFEKKAIPGDFPSEQFDLIVISEVGYFLSKQDWRVAVEQAYRHLNDNGHIVLVHWLPKVHDFPQTGDGVHSLFAAKIGDRMRNVYTARDESFRIDVWHKA